MNGEIDACELVGELSSNSRRSFVDLLGEVSHDFCFAIFGISCTVNFNFSFFSCSSASKFLFWVMVFFLVFLYNIFLVNNN